MMNMLVVNMLDWNAWKSDDLLSVLLLCAVLYLSLLFFKSTFVPEAIAAANAGNYNMQHHGRLGHCKLLKTKGSTDKMQRMHAQLPLRHGIRSITLSGNTLFNNATEKNLTEMTLDLFKASSVEMLLELSTISELFLIFLVQSKEEQKHILSLLRATQVLEYNEQLQRGIKPHRILFCTTTIGKIALVRQIEPLIHIEGKF